MGLSTRHASRYTPIEFIPDDSGAIARTRALLAGLDADSADLLRAFHAIQSEFGYVPKETIPLLAGRFKTTPAEIFGALDFYSELRQTPPAETEVEWCSGPACLLKGSLRIREVLETVLGCAMDRATPDNRVGLRLVQCDGTCHIAPQLRLDHRYLGPLTVGDAVKLARALKGQTQK